jgi:DeoR family glycerol-3-phosphate regulon repressor
MKLKRTAPIRIGHISLINTIVIDEKLPQKLRDICSEAGVAVVRVPV